MVGLVARRMIWVNGQRAETYVCGDLQRAKAQLVVIPGNPGCAEYYTDLLDRLTRHSQQALYCTSMSHLGHAPSIKTGKVFSLADQVHHQTAFIRNFVLPQDLPVVLLGHSIGAYIAAQALQHLEKGSAGSTGSSVIKVLAVFPFLSVNYDSTRQLSIRRLTRLPLIGAAAAGLLHVLPLAVRCMLVSIFTGGFNKQSLETTARLMSFGTYRNILHMGAHEFEDLAHGVAWQPLQWLGSKLLVTFAEQDTWFSEQQLGELEQKCPQAQVYRMGEMRHDFVTTDPMTEDMAQRTLQWVKESGISM